jgi:hypothetical protein
LLELDDTPGELRSLAHKQRGQLRMGLELGCQGVWMRIEHDAFGATRDRAVQRFSTKRFILSMHALANAG